MYAWGEEQVLKLFHPTWPRVVAEVEAQAARVAVGAGVPTPAVGETVEVDGRYGVVFERVAGPSMYAQMWTHPWQLRGLARQMAELHATIHVCEAPRLPSFKDEIRMEVDHTNLLEARVKGAILERLQRLPDGDALCHGDFHEGNVIMLPAGPAVVDWSCGRRGTPLADVARTWMLVTMIGPWYTAAPRLAASFARAFHALYLRHYCQLRPFSDDELASWKLPMVALRLTRENVPREQRRLMDYIERALGNRT